jgi:hypothetical protein
MFQELIIMQAVVLVVEPMVVKAVVWVVEEVLQKMELQTQAVVVVEVTVVLQVKQLLVLVVQG